MGIFRLSRSAVGTFRALRGSAGVQAIRRSAAARSGRAPNVLWHLTPKSKLDAVVLSADRPQTRGHIISAAGCIGEEMRNSWADEDDGQCAKKTLNAGLGYRRRARVSKLGASDSKTTLYCSFCGK